MNKSLRLYALLGGLVLLSACSSMPEWLGGEKEKSKFEGARIDVLTDNSLIKTDESTASMKVGIPTVKSEDSWQQSGGTISGMTGNLQISGFSNNDSVRIGDGNGWEQPLYPSPIIADSIIFAMDAKGYITAHSLENIDKIIWKNKDNVAKDEPDLLGGGLAFDKGKIFATSGRGKIIALDAASGNLLWDKAISIPLRAAPKVADGKLYAVSVDNQIFAFDVETGNQLWQHRGINENAGFLASISPSLSEHFVIAPYSSGEIHALDGSSGQSIWNDTLIVPNRTAASGTFSGIGGNPIIKDDVVYVGGSGGIFTAISLPNGRRIWEQDIATLNTPWVADDFVYVLSSDNNLVCLNRADGRIKWTKQIPSYDNPEKHKNPYSWRGPIMANGELLIAGKHGKMLIISAQDGSDIKTVDIPENITDAPIIVAGKLYVLTANAKLHVIY